MISKGIWLKKDYWVGHWEYDTLKEDIKVGAFFVAKDVRIYNPALAFFFCSKSIEVYDRDKRADAVVDGSDFIPLYLESYERGREYIRSNFNPDNLYSANGDKFSSNILLEYIQHISLIKGTPSVISKQYLDDVGKRSGIVSAIDEIIEIHEACFDLKAVHAIRNQEELNEDNETVPHQALSQAADLGPPLSFSFTNNFDSVNEDKVYNYFKAALLDKKHIKESELNNFLVAAFDKKEIPAERFSFIDEGTRRFNKAAAFKVFYGYYALAGKPHGPARQYAKLLGEYFEGHTTENVYRNWNK
jgi:hypothetical protein